MPHQLLTVSQSDFLIHINVIIHIQFRLLNDKQCRSRSVGFFRSQLIWIYTVCKGRIYLGSAGQGLIKRVLCAKIYWPVNNILVRSRCCLHICLVFTPSETNDKLKSCLMLLAFSSVIKAPSSPSYSPAPMSSGPNKLSIS